MNLMALYQMVLQLQKQLKELAINQLKVFTDVCGSISGIKDLHNTAHTLA
jgi:hypothetical protein